MNRDWEKQFLLWSKGPGQEEKNRAKNAEDQVKLAISKSNKLNSRNILVFTQGSYRNRVNVKKDSDVDIGVLCLDSFFPEYQDDNIKLMVEKNLSTATYTYSTFKNEIEEALVDYFGRESVSRGKKSFDVKENSYRVEADVAAFFEFRLYSSQTQYLSGVEMIPDDFSPPRIRNWPEQHYTNGVRKNTITGRKYKKIVRILKSLSNEMSSLGISSAKNVPSFLSECLIWNTPNIKINNSTYYQTIRVILIYLYAETKQDESCNNWGEVSELKYLFRKSQPWTREDAHKFISDAWRYIGYE